MNPTKQSPRDGLVEIIRKQLSDKIGPMFLGQTGDNIARELAEDVAAALRTSHPNAAEPVAWMLRNKTTGAVYWDEDQCVWDDSAGADETAAFTASLEPFPVYAHPPAPQDDARADVRRLVEEIEEAIEVHEGHCVNYVSFDFPTARRILAALNPTGEA